MLNLNAKSRQKFDYFGREQGGISNQILRYCWAGTRASLVAGKDT